MIQKFKNLLSNDSKFMQASWLGIGNSLGSVINILLMIILSRLLLKGEYGSFRQLIYLHATLISVVGISLSKVSSNYLPLLTLSQGKNLVYKVFSILILVSGFFGIIILLGNPLIRDFFNNEDLRVPLYTFAGIIFFTIPTLGIEGIYTSYKKTQVYGLYVIINKLLFFVFLSLPLFISTSSLDFLLILWLIQSGISFLLGVYLIYKPFIKVKYENCNISYLSIYKFIFPLILSSLLGILFTASDQFYISNYFGKEVYADFSNGSIQIPFIGILIGSIGSILHPYFIEKIHSKEGQKDILNTIKNSISKSVVLIYPLVIFIWFFSDEIFSILFDEIYRDSASFFRIIVLYNFFSVFVVLPIIIALQEVKFYNIIHILAVIFIWSLHWIGLSIVNNPLIIPFISLIIKAFIVISLLIKISQRLNTSLTKIIPLRQILSLIFSCVIIILPIIFLKHLFNENIFQTVMLLIISFILYYLLLILANKDFKNQLIQIITQFLPQKK